MALTSSAKKNSYIKVEINHQSDSSCMDSTSYLRYKLNCLCNTNCKLLINITSTVYCIWQYMKIKMVKNVWIFAGLYMKTNIIFFSCIYSFMDRYHAINSRCFQWKRQFCLLKTNETKAHSPTHPRYTKHKSINPRHRFRF